MLVERLAGEKVEVPRRPVSKPERHSRTAIQNESATRQGRKVGPEVPLGHRQHFKMG